MLSIHVFYFFSLILIVSGNQCPFLMRNFLIFLVNNLFLEFCISSIKNVGISISKGTNYGRAWKRNF